MRFRDEQIYLKKLQLLFLHLILKERDGLKAILSSYESEVTINFSAVQQERLQALEKQVELYKQEVDKLHTELQEAFNSDAPSVTGAGASSQVCVDYIPLSFSLSVVSVTVTEM